MDFRSSFAHLLRASVSALFLVAGCYNPSINNGAQKCDANGKCPEGFECYPDNHCYTPGSKPGCAPACSGATPKCDLKTLKCVVCLVDADCPAGALCKGQVCVAGCSATHPGCGADAGRCDVDMGQCRGCNSDAECAGNGGTPKCDKPTGLCVPCLPSDDQCPVGQHCAGSAGQYACVAGCTTNDQCKSAAMMNGDNKVTCCNSQCVDVTGDATNCGRCGTVCPGGSICCNAGCVDPATDVANCGSCGMACAPKNVGAPSCAASQCGYDKCTPGFGDCDNVTANGCETSTATNVMNCGACGKACGALANASVKCAASACAIDTCNMGFADCNKNPADGCEVSLATDAKNCAACNNICPAPANSAAVCVASACKFNCNANFGNCNGLPGDGCEANLTNDVNNCGMCAKVCTAGPNQTPLCTGSTCRVMCKALFGDCDGNLGNGCEANFANDPLNCSACGNKCALPNVQTNGCSGGACTVLVCAAGFGDCNNLPADGCESAFVSDVKNCGKCGQACNVGQQCINGACTSLRPNVMVCGGTGRPVSQFFPPGQNYMVLNGCAPDNNTQALFITRNWGNAITPMALQTYLSNGGIVLTEFSISYAVWNAAFGTAVAQGASKGNCSDALPSVVQFSPNDPFWLNNVFVAQQLANSGCGFIVNAFTGITLLAGWDNASAAVGYRTLGNGRLWATDFDWQDGQVLNDNGYTVALMGYMMTHR